MPPGSSGAPSLLPRRPAAHGNHPGLLPRGLNGTINAEVRCPTLGGHFSHLVHQRGELLSSVRIGGIPDHVVGPTLPTKGRIGVQGSNCGVTAVRLGEMYTKSVLLRSATRADSRQGGDRLQRARPLPSGGRDHPPETNQILQIGCAVTPPSELGHPRQSSRTSTTRAEWHNKPSGQVSNYRGSLRHLRPLRLVVGARGPSRQWTSGWPSGRSSATPRSATGTTSRIWGGSVSSSTRPLPGIASPSRRDGSVSRVCKGTVGGVLPTAVPTSLRAGREARLGASYGPESQLPRCRRCGCPPSDCVNMHRPIR